MYRMHRGEIWGGFREDDQDVCSAGITASLFSSSAHGRQGGDVYYLSVCGADRLTRIALADVVGHGDAVSSVSRWLYSALESRIGDRDGFRVLEEINDLAVARGVASMSTVALASFEPSREGAAFAYAGHAPAWVRRREEATWRPVDLDPERARQPNAPLGVVPGARYDERHEPLRPGDRVFFYTDGLVEGRDADGEPFGVERLAEVLDREAAAPLDELKRAVLDAVREHSPRAFEQDDVSLVAVEVHAQ